MKQNILLMADIILYRFDGLIFRGLVYRPLSGFGFRGTSSMVMENDASGVVGLSCLSTTCLDS